MGVCVLVYSDLEVLPEPPWTLCLCVPVCCDLNVLPERAWTPYVCVCACVLRFTSFARATWDSIFVCTVTSISCRSQHRLRFCLCACVLWFRCFARSSLGLVCGCVPAYYDLGILPEPPGTPCLLCAPVCRDLNVLPELIGCRACFSTECVQCVFSEIYRSVEACYR